VRLISKMIFGFPKLLRLISIPPGDERVTVHGDQRSVYGDSTMAAMSSQRTPENGTF